MTIKNNQPGDAAPSADTTGSLQADSLRQSSGQAPSTSSGQVLRRQAEAKLSERKKKAAPPPTTESDTRRLVHDLEVHQIELEMQNEELVQSRAETEAVLHQYTDLYDFAPIGYFTLARDGAIRQVNLVGANLMGVERGALIKRRFGVFVSVESRPAFSAFLEKVFSTSGSKETCEVALLKDGSAPLWVHIEAMTEDGQREACRAVVVDITERMSAEQAGKRAEEALQESEGRYRSLVESSDDPIYIIGQNLKYLFANNKFLSRLGKSLGEVVGQDYFQFHSTDGTKEFSAMIEKVFKSGKPVSYEHKSRRDGRVFIRTLSPIKDLKTKTITAVTVISKDITERKQAEEALRESEEKHRVLIETTDTGYLILDAQGRVIDVNKEYIRLTGYDTLEEVLGRSVVEWTAPHDLERNAAEVKKCAEQGYIRNLEIDYVNRSGQITPVEINATVVGSGDSARILSLCRDITERKQVEEALRESEEKYRLLVENAHDGIEITQHDRIIFANAQFAEMLGYTPAEIIDMKFSQIFTEQSVRELLERQKNREAGKPEPNQYETTFLKKDGTIIDVEVRYRIIDYNGEPATFAIIRDITERKQAEEALITTERIYRQVITKAGGVPYQIDYASRNYVFLGDGIESLTGYPPDEMTGLLFTSRLRQTEAYGEYKDLPRLKRDQLTLQGKIKEWREDDLFERKDGSLVWLADHSVPLFDNEGRTTGSLGILIDITERKRAEEALRESEEKYRTLFTSSRDAIMILKPPSWKFTSANQAMAEMFKFKNKDELLSFGPEDLSPERQPDGRASAEKAKEMNETAIREGFHSFEWTHKRLNGEEFMVTVLLTRMELAGEMVLQATVRDITERKRAAEELHRKEEHHRNVIESIFKFVPEGVLVLTESLNLLKHNKAFDNIVQKYAPLLGYTEEELAEKITKQLRSKIASGDSAEIRITKKNQFGG